MSNSSEKGQVSELNSKGKEFQYDQVNSNESSIKIQKIPSVSI